MVKMKLELEIEHLNQMIIKMSEMVSENLKLAIELYHEYNKEKAAFINDDIVDLHERLIEEMCLNIMLKERPYAKDLRVVSGILKLVEDLERLGDHAEDLKNLAVKLVVIEHHKCPLLEEGFSLAIEMVHNAIGAFVNQDITLANSVIQKDDIMDSLYDKSINRIIEHLNNKEYSNTFAIYTTLVIKYIERIADHAVNIAEWTIYILSGYHKDKQIF